MKDRNNPNEFAAPRSTRRQMITWSAVALGAAVGYRSWARDAQATGQSGKTESSGTSGPIHQEVDFAAPPQRIYAALIESKRFAAFTGAPADIHAEVGGAFSCFNGIISGRNVELVPNERIVQAWRVANWPPGVYSIAKFELKTQGSGTRLIFDHSGFPEDAREHLAQGWKARYWDPLQKYLESPGSSS
jgi:activator of HSP90 ATPase